jgi:hypothetical protein
VDAPQPCWQGGFAERPSGADDPEATGHLGPVAVGAVQLAPDALGPALLAEYPGPLLERRAVPDMLGVQAVQVGHPIPSVVLMEPGDPASHGYIDWR